MREKFSKGIWGFIISCVLFIGLILVNQCSDPQRPMHIYAVQRYQLWFYIVIMGVFAFQQAMVRWPMLASLGDVKYLKWTIEENLKVILREYYAALSSITGEKKAPLVRSNIMLPTRSRTWFRLKLNYLKIYYSWPSIYPADEIDLPWNMGEGTCGFAWQKKRVVIYDSERYKAPEKRLKKQHRKVVGNIKSVLSMPIWDRQSKRVIGVLNLDSRSGIEGTHFDDKETVLKRLEARAMLLSPSLASFSHGVKGQ